MGALKLKLEPTFNVLTFVRSGLTKTPHAVGRRGKDKTPRTRRSNVLKHDPGRNPMAFISRGQPIIRWTRERQARAIQDGWFLERDRSTNYVVLRALPKGALLSAQDAWAHLERQVFRNSPFHATAIAFIEQQAKHQYSYAWEPVCQTFRPSLRWLKTLARDQRDVAVLSRQANGQFK
jgi:hypothetical protein